VRRNPFTARRTAALLVLGVGYYSYVIGDRAVLLLRDRRIAFRGLGAGLLLLVVVGVALVVAEVRFGTAAQRLGRAAGDIADADFDAAKSAVEAAPEDWRAWYRLAVAYDAGRDPRRGRAAMRQAIALERAAGG
jgi:predicted kinase